MRLLHTSDWHLGRSLHGVDLHGAQRAFVSELVAAVKQHAVDAVLIAGDVFDRAVPPVAAVQLWADALDELCALVPVIAISGNHDSAIRLGAGATLFRKGVHIHTDLDGIGSPVMLRDEFGPVAVYPIPFLDPDIARHQLSSGDEPLARSHAAVLTEAMRRVHADLTHRRATDTGVRSVAMAHAFVLASPLGSDVAEQPQRSDSERDISIGGVDSVPASTFDGIDYVALGHLHGAQRVAGERVRYSGSPLRYSFSEVRQRKQALLVDLDAEGTVATQSIEMSQPRGMAVLRGTMAGLLTASEHERDADSWVQIAVTDPERPAEMRARLLERFPHALSTRHEPATGPLAVSSAGHATPIPQAPDEVAAAFVHYVTGGHISDAELTAFRQAYEAARNEDVA